MKLRHDNANLHHTSVYIRLYHFLKTVLHTFPSFQRCSEASLLNYKTFSKLSFLESCCTTMCSSYSISKHENSVFMGLRPLLNGFCRKLVSSHTKMHRRIARRKKMLKIILLEWWLEVVDSETGKSLLISTRSFEIPSSYNSLLFDALRSYSFWKFLSMLHRIQRPSRPSLVRLFYSKLTLSTHNRCWCCCVVCCIYFVFQMSISSLQRRTTNVSYRCM